MKLVHTGDWHLGPQGNRIDPDTCLNARLMDFYCCARFAIEDGVKRGAQLVLHAGDMFNGCRPTPTEVRLAKNALEPALERGIPVVVLKGNHDDVRSPAERHALDLLSELEDVTIIDRPVLLNVWQDVEDQRVAVLPPDKDAMSRGLRDVELILQVGCLPWPNKQLLLADEANRRLTPGELNELARGKMMACARRLAGELAPGIPSVLLGHFSVDTAAAGNQNRLMMLGGEWTLNVHDLDALGFSYVALGHIHKPQYLADGTIRYCGSPEAVTFGEEGEEKGYTLVDIGAETDNLYYYHADIMPTPFRRFVTLEPKPGEPICWDGLAEAIVRVRVRDADGWNLAALRKEIEAAGPAEVRIEIERAEAQHHRASEVSNEMGPEEALKAWLELKPDLEPLADDLTAEAKRVEALLEKGGAA